MKKPKLKTLRSALLEDILSFHGVHSGGFCSTHYDCCVEGNISDIQDIKRCLSFLGFVLLFLRFVNAHRQTLEDFRADCSKSVAKRLKEVMVGF